MVSLLVSFPAVPTEELVQGRVLLIFLVIPTSQCVVPDEGGFCTGNGINESEAPPPWNPPPSNYYFDSGVQWILPMHGSSVTEALGRCRGQAHLCPPFLPGKLGDHAKFSSELPSFAHGSFRQC